MPEKHRFENTGPDFSAIYAAHKWLRRNGYVWAEMQRDEPIGVHRASEVMCISKWRDLTAGQKDDLDGRITWEHDARHGAAVLTLVRPIEEVPC